jgi:hypothetical protein
VRSERLAVLAQALNCDEEYLTLRQEFPRRHLQTGSSAGQIRFGGFSEAGVWRSTPPDASIPKLAIFSVPGVQINVAYVQAGDSLEPKGIRAGMILYGDTAGRPEDGDIVIVRRKMLDLVEIAARVKTKDGYVVYSANGEPANDKPSHLSHEHVEAVIQIVQMGLFK